MTALQHDAASDARYWPVPLLRAVPLLVLGMVTTFVNDHSADLGSVVFGITTLVGGVLFVFASRRWLDDATSRGVATVQGLVGVVAGILAFALSGHGLSTLVSVVVGWAVVTGVLELGTGLRRRGRSGLARDWILAGVITLLLAVAYLIVPTGYSKELGGIEKIHGTLTSSTILVGIVGAYGALVGVFLVIQGLSLKWQTGSPEGEPEATQQTIDGVPRP